MPGNTFGQHFRVTTFGESHGPIIGAVIDGCPAGLALSVEDIQPDLDRRKPGQSAVVSQRRERDSVQIVSGLFEGKTTGAPIALLVANDDAKAGPYESLRSVFRPGHADFTYFHKYGHRDYRGGGRASARETAARVAAGAVAKKYLKEHYNLQIRGCVEQIGSIRPQAWDWDAVEKNPFFFPDSTQVPVLQSFLDDLRKEKDSIGAKLRIEAHNVPIGLGEPVFDKLHACLAHAWMSIPAVKGVEIGDGFAVVEQRGSLHRDALTAHGFDSNHAGGVLGGITTGQPLVAQLAIKPTSSIPSPIETINEEGESVVIEVTGRHDPCCGIRAVPVAEAMMALVLIDAVYS